MLEAALDADAGDEQRGLDGETLSLEKEVAALLGMPAALFFPTATMANQAAVVSHVNPGAEVLCHADSHIYRLEAGGLAANAMAQVNILNGARGMFTAEELKSKLGSRPSHAPVPGLLVMENTTNVGGGAAWPLEQWDAVLSVADAHALPVHLDGARLMNASLAVGVSPRRLTQGARSVQLCFSKGLGCPAGAILAGSEELLTVARRVRQRFGGAMRQPGYLAACARYALKHHVERLADDHERARRFHAALSLCAEVVVQPVETNMVYFRAESRSAAVWQEDLHRRGLKVSRLHDWLRACFYVGLSASTPEKAAEVVNSSLR